MQTPEFVKQFRQAFPFFKANPHCAYLDNAATSQKPQCMLDSISHYYQTFNANVHRAAHPLAAKATLAFEQSRQTVQTFINAQYPEEIIWTKGCTESINLVANALASRLEAGDEIIISQLEHHANLVPWQQLARRLNLTLTVLTLEQINPEYLSQHINTDTKLLALSHISNALGSVQAIKPIIDLCQQHQILTLIDGAQGIVHQPIDVQALGCDFYAFSSHKLYGPTGLGVLFGKKSLLEQLPPYQYGGEMVQTVSEQTSCFAGVPFKFEAGTPNIEAVIAFASVLDFLSNAPLQQLFNYERTLSQYLIDQLKQKDYISLVSPDDAIGAISFLVKNWHPQDVSEILAEMNIALRVGSHCAQPLMAALGLKHGTIRASIAAYTQVEEVDALLDALDRLTEFE